MFFHERGTPAWWPCYDGLRALLTLPSAGQIKNTHRFTEVTEIITPSCPKYRPNQHLLVRKTHETHLFVSVVGVMDVMKPRLVFGHRPCPHFNVSSLSLSISLSLSLSLSLSVCVYVCVSRSLSLSLSLSLSRSLSLPRALSLPLSPSRSVLSLAT